MNLESVEVLGVPDWSGYFGPLSAVAAAIFAIFFVAFQVNTSWRAENRELQRHSALVALYELAAPLMVSLAALLPTLWAGWLLGPCLAGMIGVYLGGIQRYRMFRGYAKRRWRSMTVRERKHERINFRWGTPINTVVFGAMFLGGVSGLTSSLGFFLTFRAEVGWEWLPGPSVWRVLAEIGFWCVAVASWWLVQSGVYQSWRQLSGALAPDAGATRAESALSAAEGACRCEPRAAVQLEPSTGAHGLTRGDRYVLAAVGLAVMTYWRRSKT